MTDRQDISAQSCLYFGMVRHARYRPRRHRFAYRVFNIYADIDALEAGALRPERVQDRKAEYLQG
jgi:DUF1365 family protein